MGHLVPAPMHVAVVIMVCAIMLAAETRLPIELSLVVLMNVYPCCKDPVISAESDSVQSQEPILVRTVPVSSITSSSSVRKLR